MLNLATGPTLFSSQQVETPIPIATYIAAIPQNETRGLAIFFHGFGLHARLPRYAALYQALARHGLVVLSWDCPHHGVSSTLGDGQGSISHPWKPLRLPSAELLANDGLEFVAAARRVYCDLPLVLIGESMGGALALRISEDVGAAAVCTIAGAVPNAISRSSQFTSMWRGNWALLQTVWAAPREEVKEAKRDPLIKLGVPHKSVSRCVRKLMSQTEYARLTSPLLAAIGTRDPFSSVVDTLSMLSACRVVDPLDRIISVAVDGRHDDTGRRPDVVETVARFAARYVRQTRDTQGATTKI